MFFKKYLQSERIKLFVKTALNLLLLLSLFANNLGVLAAEVEQNQRITALEESLASPAPPAETPQLFDQAIPTTPPSPDPRTLPADIADLSELIERRTANSATFQNDDKSYTTLWSAGPMHYRDRAGNWQAIDPAFRPAENSFVIERNAIRSRASMAQAKLSAAVGDTIIVWQANELGLVNDDDTFSSLATALPEPPNFAKKYNADQTLRYDENWTDPTLSEEIISAPGSLEHLLILNEKPDSSLFLNAEENTYLEMRATLSLLPGAELWADGYHQTEAFQTDGKLEIRGADGRIALVFDPVLAFEQKQSANAVKGQYVAYPTDTPGRWTLGVRTPWQWWADSARQYPAVIDPTMHVLQPTGYGNGIAWAADGANSVNPDTLDAELHFGAMVLGHWPGTAAYKGYVQFNSIPFMLTEAPVAIKSAWLDIEPSHVAMPYYSWSGDNVVDWEKENVVHNVTLYNLGQCPGNCGGFSMVSNPSGFNFFNVPDGVSMGTKPLLGPAPVGSGATVTTSWDVTNVLQTWNAQSPRPADGPAFRLSADVICPVTNFEGWQAEFVPNCTRLIIPAGNARLRIEYDALPILVNQNFLNEPGVPSYYENVFEDTNHHYDLVTSAGFDHWRAVAVRGNHAIDPATTTRTGLKITDYTDPLNPIELVNGVVQGPEQTAYVLLDDHGTSPLGVANLRAEVTASNENYYPADEGRNYRIEYQQANAINLTYGVWASQNISFKTDKLINLQEFDLQTGDNVLIRVTAPVTFPLEVGLASPTTGSSKSENSVSNAALDTKFEPDGQLTRTRFMGYVSTPGTWGLALVNQGRPVPHPIRITEGIAQPVTVEILACPLGTIATAKWDCQPLILPDSTTPPTRSALGLNVYSEGGFIDNGDDWCTTNEGDGAPIIGPDSSGRWTVVAQGSVCKTGNVISTTVDSGVAIAIPIPNPNPFPDGTTRGKIIPTFIYGDTGLYPLPEGYPTGTVLRNGTSTQLEPTATTRRNLEPFDQFWGDVFTPAPDYISTDDMKAYGGGTVSADVTVDAANAPENISWAVPWSLYPEETAPLQYNFDVVATQTPVLASPSIIASLQLRVLDNANNATGRVEEVDAFKLQSNITAGQFRADKSKVTQDADLGGATKNAQTVIQPPGMARLPANQKSCSDNGASTSCLDLRPDDYAWGNGEGDKNVQLWELPDVHITDAMGTKLFSRPGEMQIFSVDHPNSKLADVDQSFSFDTWGASVSVKEEACTEGGPIVTVVRGSANIAVPSVGDDGSGGPPAVTVNFKLCQAKLNQAQLILEIPSPGIPVGSTGVGVYLIGGTVTIDPDFTQIELQLGFGTMDGATLTDGNGTILIDTRGLFDLQASATIVGILDAELHLQVAWNPIDILLEASVSCCGTLISGYLHMHAWVGQGWQNKYHWLPDNKDFHFTGSIEAGLYIPKGYVADLGLTELPPFDFSISIRIAFGEFCTNAACTDYDWGMSGSLTIAGFAIGLYVDGSGPEFIFGSDDHVLIDQFNSSNKGRTARAKPIQAEIFLPGQLQLFLAKPVKTPVDDWPIQAANTICSGSGTPVHTCPFNVSNGAGRALFTVGWENGDLDVALIKPDTTVITAGNAISHGIVVSETTTLLAKQISFGVPQGAIVGGQWQLQLSNVITNPADPYQTNYQILFAADPPPPTLTWNTPTGTAVIPDGSGIVNLNWTALRAGQALTAGTKIELVYTPIDTKPVTPTLYTGTLLASQISANAGSYAWDTNGLASGEYAVGGRIDDHAYGNGSVVAWAPGSIVISDTTPPPVPIINSTIDQKDALTVIWQRDNTTPDLSGYLVQYDIPDWDVDAPHISRTRRVLPHAPWKWPWFEQIRLGGLLNGQPTTVCVRAYDASGNISGCNPFTHTVSSDPRETLGPPRRVSARGDTGDLAPINEINVNWISPSPATGTPAGYILSYDLAGCIMPNADSIADQGASPLDVGDVLAYTLTGLTVGQTYRIAVNAYTAEGYIGPEEWTTVLNIDPADDDLDGLPDQWASLYGLTNGPTGDRDKDGISDFDEFILKTHPLKADSDGDGYDDNEEVDWGTDPCGPEHPPYHNGPKLTVVGLSELNFTVAQNQSFSPLKELLVMNFGAGTMDWSASASAPWVELGNTGNTGGGRLPVQVNPAGLNTGFYTATITIVNQTVLSKTAKSQLAPAPETVSIAVNMQVVGAKDFEYLYLPLVLK